MSNKKREKPWNKNYEFYKNYFIYSSENKYFNDLFNKYSMMEKDYVIVKINYIKYFRKNILIGYLPHRLNRFQELKMKLDISSKKNGMNLIPMFLIIYKKEG